MNVQNDIQRPPVEFLRNESHERIRRECMEEIERLRQTDLPSREFPIESQREAFVFALENHEVVSVQATTGAGKSLDIGVWAVDVLGGGDTRIAMTQPRRDAAQGVAIASAARHDLSFGKDICFSTSEFHGNTNETKLQIQTTGVLINQFRKDPLLKRYDAVIVDEAHERDLNIDFTLGLLKRANRLRKEAGIKPIKIILASATLDEDKFIQFFGIEQDATIKAEGKMFPVGLHFVEGRDKFIEDQNTKEKAERPFTDIAARQAIKILSSTKSGDILIFMPGIRTIEDVRNRVESGLRQFDINYPVEVLTLHGSNTQRERSDVLRGSQKNIRRVIISTNIAETSLTVPKICYVIDGAKKNEMHFDIATGLETLTEVSATKAECIQRKGRAGRLQSGEYYTVLSNEEYAKLEDYPTPEMRRLDITAVVLQMLRLGITDVENFDYIDPPKPEVLQEALKKLELLGAIDENRQLTKVGEIMSSLPLEPRLARVVAGAIETGSVKEAVSVSCLIQKFNVFRRARRDEIRDAEVELREKALYQRVRGEYSFEKEIFQLYSENIESQKGLTFQQMDQYTYRDVCREFCLSDDVKKFCAEKNYNYDFVVMGARLYRQRAREIDQELKQKGERIQIDVRDARNLANESLKKKHEKFQKGAVSDWSLFLKVFNEFVVAPNKHLFCEENALDYDVLEKAVDDYYRIINELKKSGVTISSSLNEENFTLAILQGYAPDHLLMQERGRHGVAYNRVDRGDRSIRINSSSIVQNAPLSVALALNPGKGNLTVGRDHDIETQFKYAVGVHPVTSDLLHRAVPQCIEREKDVREFVFQDGKVFNQYTYFYKIPNKKRVELPIAQVFERSQKAVEFFAYHIVRHANFPPEIGDGFFHLTENREVATILDQMVHRSRGKIAWKNCETWYASKLGKAQTVDEAQALGSDHFILRVEDICSKQEIEELDKISPSMIKIGEQEFPIIYTYTPETKQSNSLENEKLSAVLDVRGKDEEQVYYALFSISESQKEVIKQEIPALFEEKDFAIQYRMYGMGRVSDLEEAKRNVERTYFEKKYSEWKKPEAKRIHNIFGIPFKSFEEYGCNLVPYTKNYFGEDVCAYPGIVYETEYVNGVGYVPKYSIQYFQEKEQSDAQTEKSSVQKNEIESKEQRKIDRETLLEKADTLLKEVKEKVDKISENYQEFGFSYSNFRDLERKFGEAFYCIGTYNNDKDPRKAITLLWEISETIEKQKEEYTEKKRMADEIGSYYAKMQEIVREKLSSSRYDEFGITYDEFSQMSQKWLEAERALTGYGVGRRAERVPIDPLRAKELFEEIERFLSKKIKRDVPPSYTYREQPISSTWGSSGSSSPREAPEPMGTLADLLSSREGNRQRKVEVPPPPVPKATPKQEIKEEEMTNDIRLELLREVSVLQMYIEESLTGFKKPKVNGKPTDRDKAFLALFEKVGNFKAEIATLEEDTKSENAKPASLRGRIGSVKGSVRAWLNTNLRDIVPQFNKEWMSQFETLLQLVSKKIDENSDAKEFIESEMITKEKLTEMVRQELRKDIQNLQQGKPCSTIESCIERALGTL